MSCQELLLFGTIKLSPKLSSKNRFSSFSKSLTAVFELGNLDNLKRAHTNGLYDKMGLSVMEI